MGPAGSTPYNCSPEFQGEFTDFTGRFTNPSWAVSDVKVFQDPGLSLNFSTVAGQAMNGGTFTPVNPIYISAYGIVPGFGGGDAPLIAAEGFTGTETQALGFVMGCNVTVYNLQYTWFNDSVRYASMAPSNTSVVRILTAPFVTSLANLATPAQSAVGEITPDAFVQQWILGFSTMVLRLSAGVMEPRANIIVESRTTNFVACVRKSLLIMLLFLNLLYAVVGVALVVLAARSKPRESNNVQGRLSIAGLTAACFESRERIEGPIHEVEELFAEKIVEREGELQKVVAGNGSSSY